MTVANHRRFPPVWPGLDDFDPRWLAVSDDLDSDVLVVYLDDRGHPARTHTSAIIWRF